MNCGSPVIGSYVRFSMQVQFYHRTLWKGISIVSLIVNPDTLRDIHPIFLYAEYIGTLLYSTPPLPAPYILSDFLIQMGAAVEPLWLSC